MARLQVVYTHLVLIATFHDEYFLALVPKNRQGNGTLQTHYYVICYNLMAFMYDMIIFLRICLISVCILIFVKVC